VILKNNILIFLIKELILYILNHLQKRTSLKNICIAEGVTQNSVTNGKILQFSSFENLYIPSAGYDAGISMGSALYPVTIY
jgi:carbamoyltransferase